MGYALFQISLGKVSPNSSIIISVTYIHIISSDTIEDSIRLTIPAGLASRPGRAPASEVTQPEVATPKNAVTITIGIVNKSQIISLDCISHHATTTYGFSDDSWKGLSPLERQDRFQNNKAYVEFASREFFKEHFVLIWTVPGIDHARCTAEVLDPPTMGKPETIAFALTLVSNIDLDPEEHGEPPRCSVIVITDGLDWGVTDAMHTVQNNATSAAAKSQLLRVFVVGLGDDVSRGMCEALARAGSGATTYVSESQLADRDHLDQKAKILITSINRAPIRVHSIDWGMEPAQNASEPNASGNNLSTRSKLDERKVGPASKGDNLPEPMAIQQTPQPGTLFWAIRSSWYEIPGSTIFRGRIEVNWNIRRGKPIHCIAARALIQALEDKAASITNTMDKYENECEIVRLGKVYNLASTQTSFIATSDGVGTQTYIGSNASPGQRSLLAAVPSSNGPDTGPDTAQVYQSDYSFASASSGTDMSNFMAFAPMSFISLANIHAGSEDDFTMISAPDTSPESEEISTIIAAQSSNGVFDPSTVEKVAFPRTGIPAIPAFISILEDRDQVKKQIWVAICVIAFFQQKHASQEDEWLAAKSKAENFVKTTLCCIFGLDSQKSENIYINSLNDAEGHFLW
ncbi:hypothetical protein TWF106_009654 [Orbilia oligospora]|uniref:VWFA domain-containing protein n=1 Tax=Orbilia oligospora TaxID=2813651 RepID=A0A7C8QH60_ORBOL|nr:hypothetical protein TWF106_009654 [Orbilia oligospora]